jgi:Zn-dependent protease/CBS domain-containing protein
MVLLFSCVLLHELGHCVVARRFGVTITAITLYPFGGIAVLNEIPREPSREIRIAIAGPIVNFLIAAGLYLVLGLMTPAWHPELFALTGTSLLESLFIANLSLGLFNLVPAYPLDGGRILRGILAIRMNYATATHWAARIGKVFGGLFVLGGIVLQDWWLPILGVFLYIGANSEEQATLLHSAMEGLSVKDLMITDYLAVSPADTLSTVLSRSFHTFQEDFPVLRDGNFLGVLTRGRLIETLREEERDQFVQCVTQPVRGWVSPSDPLREALKRMNAERVSLLPVREEGRMVGIVTLTGILRGASVLAGRPPVR